MRIIYKSFIYNDVTRQVEQDIAGFGGGGYPLDPSRGRLLTHWTGRQLGRGAHLSSMSLGVEIICNAKKAGSGFNGAGVELTYYPGLRLFKNRIM